MDVSCRCGYGYAEDVCVRPSPEEGFDSYTIEIAWPRAQGPPEATLTIEGRGTALRALAERILAGIPR